VLLGVAAETGTALEINGSLERLDLKDTHVYRARELGVPLVITSDSHTAEAFDNLRHGVSVAKRGWCEARHVLNTWPASELLAFLKTPKAERGRVFASRG
jgi:DNA polymerase (family 10)